MENTANNHVVPVNSITKEAWKLESPKHRRRSIVREFALNTSTHGLPGMARSQSKHNRIFWTISFFIFAGIMIYFVTQSIKSYFEYPTQTSVSISFERSQVFPAVTFCNYVGARYDRLIEPFLNYTNSINATNTNGTTTFTMEQTVLLRDFLRVQLNAGEPLTQYLFSLDEILIQCLYNDKNCATNDFISFLSSTYGQCFTFNAKKKTTNESNIRYTNDDGGSGNLILRLYAQSHLYVPFVAQDVSAGMVAMIHDNTQLPLIDVAGMVLAPGRRHKLGYKKKTYQYLSLPYTDCTTKIPPAMQAMFSAYEGADYAYSQGVCYTLCIQAYIYQECGCINPDEWTARSVVLPGTNTIIQAPLCSSNNTCYLNATVRISKTLSIWNQFCSDCLQECSTVSFTVTSSSIAAPSPPYAYATKNFVESLSIPLPTNWSRNWLSEVQNNFVSLEVVCESTQVESYIQQASLGPVDLLSNVGGQTGLWIGISFLSVMEFIEMVYRILRYEFHIIRETIRNRLQINNT
ncbi:unnamed protein product [Rotaria sordida]|uniref:Uncharacterized protein n=1 Tax=Rotaria sordida TaxID=392033 RepID=A0A818XKU7_9BILA|nr:unnamed protein product [Rotaria sordida]CAF0831935.1 unnamed protein product [Rotaria sordida]CAF1010861.1 unnamed protein product [Rotaria sordida]CAF3563530.1 unnamed protein product [Rotaria sordida]CAF3724581.1 unnamed protein product [Rotaria sordida]